MSEHNNKLSVTLKAHGGFNAPWVVFYGDSAAEVADRIQGAEASGLFAIVGRAANTLAAQCLVGSELGGEPVVPPAVAEAQAGATTAPEAPPQPPPAAPAQPYGVATKTCPHGTKTYKTAAPNAPKQWAGWFCPTPKGTPGQCEVEWDNGYAKRKQG